jgi:hypothetical protein
MTFDTRTVQLYESGRVLLLTGDPLGDFVVREGDEARPPTDEERDAVGAEVRAQRLFDEDVLSLDTSLVDALVAADAAGELPGALGGEWELPACGPDPDDWDLDECSKWLKAEGADLPYDFEAMPRMELAVWLKEEGEDVQPEETKDGLLERLRQVVNDSNWLDEFRDAVREHAQDNPPEIYEWRRVSKFLGKELATQGEPVLDNDFGVWWGRTCTGQSVLLDGVLQAVARSLVARTSLA